MAKCIVCGIDVDDYQLNKCEQVGTLGVYCDYHLDELLVRRSGIEKEEKSEVSDE